MFHPITDGALHPKGWRCNMHVCGQYEARQLGLACGVTHMVSIKSMNLRLLSLEGLPASRHLVLNFDDVCDANDRAAPTAKHVQSVCGFVDSLQTEDGLIVHCAQGISRSTAMALGILACYLPPGEAGAALHRLRPMAEPNHVLVRLWDAHLGSEGALIGVARRFPCRNWTSAA